MNSRVHLSRVTSLWTTGSLSTVCTATTTLLCHLQINCIDTSDLGWGWAGCSVRLQCGALVPQ
eukprot:3097286-Rhodomonas_salina.2